jgi:twitching motility protein PilT
MRTREYVEKGEGEGKTLLDAMRDGGVEGMQDFDGAIETLVRSRAIDLETGLAYASNPGNLRLQLTDFSPDAEATPAVETPSPSAGKKEQELEVER